MVGPLSNRKESFRGSRAVRPLPQVRRRGALGVGGPGSERGQVRRRPRRRQPRPRRAGDGAGGGVRRRGARGGARGRRDRRPGVRPGRREALMDGRGRRVAVTGYGVIARTGIGREAFWDGLNGPGITGARTVSIPDWDPSPYYASPKESRRADQVEQLAVATAAQAFEHAGELELDPARIGTIFATGVGGLKTTEEQITVMLEKGDRRVSPFLVPMMMPNAAGAAISMRYGLQGPNETITTACAASTHAVGYAARLIAWGRCDAVVTGGSEAANCRVGVV